MNQVCIYGNNNFTNPLTDFHIMSIKVGKHSRATNAPIESGQTSTDYKVIEPIRISVDGYVDCSKSGRGFTALNLLNTMIKNRSFQFYSVVTRDAEYNNLILQACPHDEDADNLTMAHFHLDFIEAMIVQGKSSKASNSDNSNFTQKGYTAKVS